jgi:hypothetical protein
VDSAQEQYKPEDTLRGMLAVGAADRASEHQANIAQYISRRLSGTFCWAFFSLTHLCCIQDTRTKVNHDSARMIKMS